MNNRTAVIRANLLMVVIYGLCSMSFAAENIIEDYDGFLESVKGKYKARTEILSHSQGAASLYYESLEEMDRLADDNLEEYEKRYT